VEFRKPHDKCQVVAMTAREYESKLRLLHTGDLLA